MSPFSRRVFKGVIFDLDGTLLDSLASITDSMNELLEQYGLPGHRQEKYAVFVGDGLENLIRRSFPERFMQTEARVRKCIRTYRDIYRRRWPEKTRLFTGVASLLKRLSEKGIPMAVLSNKTEEFTQMIVHSFVKSGLFTAVWGARDDRPLKPDPSAALEIAAGMNREPGQVVFVGDSGVDMETGVNAGMTSLGVRWGFRSEEELYEHGAYHVLKHPGELSVYF